MDDKKYKRLQYLAKNVDYLSIRERLEYDELLNEYARASGTETAVEEPAADFYEPEEKASDSDFTEDFDEGHDSSYSSPSSPSASVPLSKRGRSAQKSSDDKQDKKGKKNKKGKKKRHWGRWILALILLIIVTMGGFFAYGYQRGVKHEGGVIKAEKFNGQANSDGSTNILILGADQRPWQTSGIAHSDSIMVLHIGGKGKPQLVSFMRDTLVNIPGVNADGSNDVNYKINAAYTIGEQNNHQGAELMRETLQENFGIKCQYYAVVDFSSFATIIDSLFPGGIEIDAQFSTVGGQTLPAVPVPDDLADTEGMASSDKSLTAEEAAELGYPDGGGIFMMIQPGKQKMNGRTLLNYARFRHDDEGDTGRVKRQQQVMQTIISKVKNPLSLFTGASALGTARAVTMTNIPNSVLMTKMLFSLLGMKDLSSTTVPSANDWQDGYDLDGGSGLLIDFNKYKSVAEQLLGS
ncbi:LCP family protein [Lactococcus termiticola]|uniref:Regulatory protein MsrR n=1 Tax=Lactococcus termiticola TaxID=2169526 RepID=A0A2R5HHG5_9LACT|nr:LCP family protein [Lactococcus termiticola]GBG97422.1 transcriptional regulator [Lactococcus termiticola]